MPLFSFLASKVAPLGKGVHREYRDSMVQLIRNGGSLPSCTSKVLTSGTFVVERQYASKVSWSQFLGTPLLLSGVDARVAESRTVIRIVFFGEDAFANMATNTRPACKAAILRILIGPTPPNPADASLAYQVFRTILEASPAGSVHFAPAGVSRTIALLAGGSLGGQTHLRAIARVVPVPFSLVTSAF